MVERWETSMLGVPRAPRFPIMVPLQFRTVGQQDWSEALTENISRSGVLFATEFMVEDPAPVELRFVLLSPGGTESPQVVCVAYIVRTDRGADPCRVGARFRSYRFPGEEADA